MCDAPGEVEAAASPGVGTCRSLPAAPCPRSPPNCSLAGTAADRWHGPMLQRCTGGVGRAWGRRCERGQGVGRRVEACVSPRVVSHCPLPPPHARVCSCKAMSTLLACTPGCIRVAVCTVRESLRVRFYFFGPHTACAIFNIPLPRRLLWALSWRVIVMTLVMSW